MRYVYKYLIDALLGKCDLSGNKLVNPKVQQKYKTANVFANEHFVRQLLSNIAVRQFDYENKSIMSKDYVIDMTCNQKFVFTIKRVNGTGARHGFAYVGDHDTIQRMQKRMQYIVSFAFARSYDTSLYSLTVGEVCQVRGQYGFTVMVPDNFGHGETPRLHVPEVMTGTLNLQPKVETQVDTFKLFKAHIDGLKAKREQLEAEMNAIDIELAKFNNVLSTKK